MARRAELYLMFFRKQQPYFMRLKRTLMIGVSAVLSGLSIANVIVTISPGTITLNFNCVLYLLGSV